MRHDRPISTAFGGAFVKESRRPPPTGPAREDRSWGPLAILLLASLLSATIPAVAITANSHLRAAEAARWQPPLSYSQVPGFVGFERATLY